MKAVMLGKLFKPAGRIIALAITAGMLGLFAYNAATLEPSFLNLMDKKWVDFIIKERGAQPHSGRVVIAAVDTLSVDRYGRWPWPRARMAELVEALTDHYEVRTIGFDIVFSEAEREPGGDLIESVKDRFNRLGFEPSAKADRFLQFLEGAKAGVHGDARFAGALAKADNSVLGYFFFSRRGSVAHLSEAEIATAKASLAGLEISDIKGPVDRGTVPIGLLPEPNIEAIGEAALSAGFFNIIPDREDGVIRRTHLLMQFGDNVYPALGLQVFRQYLGAEAIAIETDQSGFIRTIKVGDRLIVPNFDGSILLNFKGPEGTFPRYSVFEIIERKIPKVQLQDRIVLVGATEIGLSDFRNTPVSVALAGVEIHATLLDNLLTDTYFEQTLLNDIYTLFLMLCAGLLLAVVLPMLRNLHGTALVLALVLGYTFLHSWMVTELLTWPSYVYVALTLLAVWAGVRGFDRGMSR